MLRKKRLADEYPQKKWRGNEGSHIKKIIEKILAELLSIPGGEKG